jgi:hypothetical protein
VPLLPALGVTLQDAEPLAPVLTVYSMGSRADVSPPLVCAVMPAGSDVAAAPVWPVALGLAVWGVAKSRSCAQALVALVEPTLLAPVQSPMASVGLVSRSVGLLPLAQTVVEQHRAVEACLCCNALAAESPGAWRADVLQKAYACPPLLAQYPALYCHNATRAAHRQDALHALVWASRRLYHLSAAVVLPASV